MAHLPWYLSPVKSCVDCQVSEGGCGGHLTDLDYTDVNS